MVSKKKLEFGFNGYRAPIIPRAPRSTRKRSPLKAIEASKFCAFELLAAVAGQLLLENESSASSVAEGKVNENGLHKENKPLKSECFDYGSCDGTALFPEVSVQECRLLSDFSGLSPAESTPVLGHSFIHENSDSLEKVDGDIKFELSEKKNLDENNMCKVEEFDHKVERLETQELQEEMGKNEIGGLSMDDKSTIKNPIGERMNTNSDSSVQLSLYRDPIHCSSLGKHCNNVKVGIKDDDENYFGCNKFSTKLRSFRPQPCNGLRRIRKMLKSKYWKVAPKVKKDYEFYNTSEGMKTFHRYRKIAYVRERFQRELVKKRKLSDHSFAIAYDHGAGRNSTSNLSRNGEKGDKSSSSMILHRESGKLAAVKGHKKVNDPYVKFSIKSFRVPELCIEVPETATIGSLKRSVMEAVNAILGGGMRVGVVLQGKKVRDNSRTLQQAGISQSSNLDNLGFTFEPNSTCISPSTTVKLPLVLPCDTDQQLPRSPTPINDAGVKHTSYNHALVHKDNNDFINNELISSPKTPTDASVDGMMPESKALVSALPVNVEALSAVPLNSKHKCSELSQRRIRRPFSVQEVESLVEAVETLGTGRWRDVKLRAFENSDHRTYVDLKDKWKTLVHTGSIAPQQRRGEPVPQELLNRVLDAHSYWSQNQSKQLGKPVTEPLKIEDAGKEILEA